MPGEFGSAMPHIQSPECPCTPRVEETRAEDGTLIAVVYHHHDYETGAPLPPPATE